MFSQDFVSRIFWLGLCKTQSRKEKTQRLNTKKPPGPSYFFGVHKLRPLYMAEKINGVYNWGNWSHQPLQKWSYFYFNSTILTTGDALGRAALGCPVGS